jgi:hypothetical protein
MNRLTLFAALLIPVLVPALAGPARADAPVIGEVSWRRADAHCAFARIGAEAPPDSYLFVTELVSDDSISIERGYMRIDGLLRELQLVERSLGEGREVRHYRTFGEAPAEVRLTMTPRESRQSSQGQTVYVKFEGTLVASRGLSQRQVGFSGDCGVPPSR